MKRDKLTSRKLGTVKFPPQRDNDDSEISPSSETKGGRSKRQLRYLIKARRKSRVRGGLVLVVSN